MSRWVLRKGLWADGAFLRHYKSLLWISALQLLQEAGAKALGPAKRIHLGVILDMFQPLPVGLDHALNADTVHLGGLRMGALQEVELLTGKGRMRTGGKWGGTPPISTLTLQCLCKGSSSGKASISSSKGRWWLALRI